MDLIRRSNPLLGSSILGDFDRIFDNFLEPLRLTNTQLNLPSINVYSDDDRTMVVAVEAPGFDRDDLEISAKNGALEIRGERTQKEEPKDKKRNYVVRENSTSFYRRIALPEGADTEKIAAELDKGVLRVSIPVERAEAKRIQIATPDKKSSGKLSSGTDAK